MGSNTFTQKEAAIVSANLLVQGQLTSADPFDLAKSFLAPIELTRQEFDSIGKKWIRMKLDLSDGETRATVSAPYVDDDLAPKLLNGKIVHFIFAPLWTQNQEEYVIQYNADGKGGIRLPNGKMSDKDLKWLSSKLINERNLKTKKGNPYKESRYRWSVSHSHHPEVRGRKSLTIKDYMREFYDVS